MGEDVEGDFWTGQELHEDELVDWTILFLGPDGIDVEIRTDLPIVGIEQVAGRIILGQLPKTEAIDAFARFDTGFSVDTVDLRERDDAVDQLGRGCDRGREQMERLIRSEEHTSELQSLMRISY